MILTKESKMPDNLRVKVEKLTPYQRKYCEYRAKGLKQADAAEKAGSGAADRAAMSRGGYNIEQMDGAKDYILWLQEQRARASVVDEIEVIEKLRAVYEQAMDSNKFAEANKAAELLGNAIGMFKPTGSSKTAEVSSKDGPKNNTKAFKEDSDDTETSERLSKLAKLISR